MLYYYLPRISARTEPSAREIDPHVQTRVRAKGASEGSEGDAGSGRRSMRSKKASHPPPPSPREAFYLVDKKGGTKKAVTYATMSMIIMGLLENLCLALYYFQQDTLL